MLSEITSSQLPHLGILLTLASHMRYQSPILAWIANVPYIMWYTNEVNGDRMSFGNSAAMLLYQCVAWTLVVCKIVTPPLSYFISPMFGVPIGFFQTIGYILWKFTCVHSQSSEFVQALGFAASMVTSEWFQHKFTPYGTWGAMAYTQVSNLPFLQSASVFGIAGPGFLVYWFSSVLALALNMARTSSVEIAVNTFSPSFLTWGILMVITNIWGSYRMEFSGTKQNTVTIASVITDSTFGGAKDLPSETERDKMNETLWKRTKRAADAGAKLVSWTEAATLTLTEDEEKFLKKGQEVAKQLGIELILAYIVPIEFKPALKYENKAVWIQPNGDIHHSYLKNEPVPGEPAVRGDSNVVITIETFFGVRSAIAICYDYDFPYIGRKHAKRCVQLAIVPSSDWLGIDPIHTQMAAVRAIEGGFSILRTTRMGLSAGIDSFGRIRGQISANETDQERVLLTTVPIKNPGTTFYGRNGDLLVYCSFASILLLKIYNAE